MNQMRIVRLAWKKGELGQIFNDVLEVTKAAIINDVLKTSKTAIIKTIQQELYPLMGMFDEIDNAIEQFENDIKETNESNRPG